MDALRRIAGARRRRNQLQRLRLRLIAGAMASIAGALLAIFAVVNVWNYLLFTQQVDYVVDMIHDHGGEIPDRPPTNSEPQITLETPFETRYFVVAFDADRATLSIDTDHIAAIDRDAAGDSAAEILAEGREQGYWGQYRYHVYLNEDGGGSLVVVDCFRQFQAADTLLTISASVMAACIVVTLIVIVPLSKRIMRPYIRNLERQRRFVTDASHELKTPVAIITANVELMEELDGETQWTRSTKKQAGRLTELIGDLMELARADELDSRDSFSDVDVSRIVERGVEDFLPLAEASEKHLITSIDEGAVVKGDEASLTRLVSVLLDNAIKYSDEHGDVEVTLSVTRGSVQLVVSNPASSLTAGETSQLFERFYRPDAARERSAGGYGIGLSIARSIVERHGGEIRARKLGDILEISASLPGA